MSLKKLIHPTLIFIFSISLKSFASCLPVSFDHIFFNVSPKAYEQIGKSDFFKTDHLSFFEAFKNPFGDHRGHYITGQKHYLEVFNSKDRKNKAPIGIGFISETKNCLPIIQQALQSSLPDFFKMRKKENWGQMTEALTTNMHLWVSELDPNFLGSPNEKIDRFYQANLAEFNIIEEVDLFVDTTDTVDQTQDTVSIISKEIDSLTDVCADRLKTIINDLYNESYDLSSEDKE
jgi:hypothetical protein